MKKDRSLKQRILAAFMAIVMLTSSLIGTTFAWFTDSVTSDNNVIQTGNLDAQMHWSDELLDYDSDEWNDAEDGTPVFNYNNWEPGYTEVKYVKVSNAGSLNFKWKLSIEANGAVSILGDVIDVYYVNPVSNQLTSLDGLTSVGKLADVLASKTATSGELTPGGNQILAIAFHMDELAGNEYQNTALCDGGFSLKLLATQATGEFDSFGDDYDAGAQWPEGTVIGNTASADVTADANNKLNAGASMTSADGKISASVPAGTLLSSGTNKLTLNVANIDKSQANITLDENEASLSIDVHILGVAENNETVMAISVKELLPVGLNMGNYRFYHVEDGQTVEMTLLADGATPAHNNYEYDPATGDVVLHLASFSEVALVAEPAKWEGKFDYSWYTNAVVPVDGESVTEYTIANADQLAAFGAIVGNMAEGIEQDSFAGKTVKLLADINLGDKESENNSDIIFYPIGYWNNEGTYERLPADQRENAVESGLYSFCGTFDGNGHTVANFYQNTWEMKGDHNWYDPIKEQYYRDGMGLFGRVYGGTIKNLTVKNFSSDGEIATTGVIAAYADFGATFENIAIFNCNPRVYNIGNGGIVGCVGWYTKGETDKKVTFTNITVDNSNKISALWGSYDVACGGIVGQYYPTSGQTSAGTPKNAGVDFVNCHVSAIMDVYNDVCANYQYYAYRYTGMLIGSVRENETIDGHVYPKMNGITAKDCTVHFGDWNDYYYCELVANSLASYTHDHQMSRLTQVASVDVANKTVTDLKGNTIAIPTSGRVNYVVVKAKDANGMWVHGDGHDYAECYHFVNGVQHFHDVADADNPNPTETVNGVAGVLKEDKQLIYREFNQLFTGYGWGVTSKGVTDYEGVENMDITIGDHEESVEKFKGKVTELANNKTYTLGEIFDFVDKGVELVPGALAVGITNLDENNPISATIVYDRENWENGTITLTGTGEITITIQDYYFCTPTTIEVTVTDRQPEVKFETKFTGDFLYRVGNQNAVALGSLFKAKDGAKIGTVSVTVETITGASGTYTSNATWTNGTIQFNGTGIVKVTITDNDYCIPTELYLEVVDATNVTGLSGTLSGNVVLLNNCGLSSLTVSGRNTVFGNGFTATYSGNGQSLNNGLKYGVINVSGNGALDNLRVIAPVYPKAYLYYSSTMMGDYVQGGPYEDSTNGKRYHYQLSAVAVSGNATVSNCYIYGGRTNILVNSGNVTIEDTILECGTVANSQIISSNEHTVTFNNVTTIQYLVDSNVSDVESQKMLGLGILVGDGDAEKDDITNPKIVLNGEFKQYNWVNEDDQNAVSSNDVSSRIIKAALDASSYNHTINGKNASNLGIIYLNNSSAQIENNTELNYVLDTIWILSASGQVYSIQNGAESQIYSDYENADRSTENGLYKPQFKYDANLGGQYIKDEGGDEFCYREGDTIKVMFPSGDTKELDLAALVNIVKYSGQDLNLQIQGEGVNNGKITLSVAGEYTVTYTVTDTLFYDKDGKTYTKTIEYSWDVIIEVFLKDTKIPNAYFEFDANAQKMGYERKSSTNVKQYIPFLAGLKIYDYNGKESYPRFDGDKDYNKVASVTITGYLDTNGDGKNDLVLIEVKLTDGGVINTQFLPRANSSGSSTYTGSIKTSNNVIYFVNDGATKESDKTTTAAYWYVNFYKFTGNNGVEITSAQQTFNSTGSSKSTPSGSFSTKINSTVTYDANGGNCGQTTGYATSVATAVTLPTPTRSGFTFLGWYTAASGGTRIGGAGDSYTPSANITLYAQWIKIGAVVTYNANGGSVSPASATVTGISLILPTPTRDGYWFVGWYDAAEGGNKIGDAGDAYNPLKSITLYAHWQKAIEYTVTYNAKDGSVSPASATYQGTKLILPTPSRTGYKFLGWYTSASGGTKIGDAGAEYIPSANITLYAQWERIAYNITYNSSYTSKVDGPTTAYFGDTVTVTVVYDKGQSSRPTVTGNVTVESSGSGTNYIYTFEMPANDVTMTITGESCVTPDTLITLADGSQVRVDSLTGDEMLLVWNMETGKFDFAPIMFVDSEAEAEFEVVKLYFSDGTEVKVIGEHGFWDYDLNKYVYLDRNAADYIGHTFAKQNGDSLEKVTLVDVVIETELTTAWSPVTVGHLCYFVNGMLSMPGGVGGLFNIFEVDPETMTYDYEQIEKDIETYGLFTYEELNAICPLTEEMFNAAGGAYLKISIGKGNLTIDELINMINRYSKYI